MAKRFFFVCAGLFLLALTYHLGAKSAGAQGAGTIVCVNWGQNSNPPQLAFVSDRTFYLASASSPCSPIPLGGPIPGSSPVVNAGFGGSADYNALVVLDNGDVYSNDTSFSSWTLRGNLLCATSAQRATWGQIKGQYRK